MPSTKGDKTGDMIVMLSSDLIGTIAEQYFNDTVFKQRATVVDLQATEGGYAFTVSLTDTEIRPGGVIPPKQLPVSKVEKVKV